MGAALGDLDAALAMVRTPKTVSYVDPYTGEERSAEFGAEELMRLIHLASYQPLFIATFPQLFRDARSGRWGPLLAQLKIAEATSGIAMGLHFAVACAEDVPLLSPTDVAAEASTRLGRSSIDVYLEVCRDWPRLHEAKPKPPLMSDVPVLLLSGAWDPVTPPEGAAEVASHLPHALNLTLPGQGHNVIGTGCVPRLVERFITAGTEVGLDTSCLQRIKPLPPFISRTGWAP